MSSLKSLSSIFESRFVMGEKLKKRFQCNVTKIALK